MELLLSQVGQASAMVTVTLYHERDYENQSIRIIIVPTNLLVLSVGNLDLLSAKAGHFAGVTVPNSIYVR